MMSHVVCWRKARLGQPEKKKKPWLQLIRTQHALSAHTSICLSYPTDFMVTANVIFHLSSEMKVKLLSKT